MSNFISYENANSILSEYADEIKNKQNIIQYSTMPAASASNVGKIVQFIGATTENYTNGYFYKCVENDGTYLWITIDTQAPKEELVPLVPIMTSNTTPSGIASASSTAASGFEPYKAFIRRDTQEQDRWVAASNVTDAYIQYQFEEPVCAQSISFKARPASRKNYDTPLDTTITIQASNDNFVNDSHNLATISVLASKADEVVYESLRMNKDEYLCYRLQFNGADMLFNNQYWCGITLLQFYKVKEVSIYADNVIYDNTDSGLSATNVQDAIDELSSSSGSGDMSKTTYDTNDDGIVNAADVADAIKFSKTGGDINVSFGVENGSYGYYDENNTFVDFKSQADIDSAVAAAKVGTATQSDVLSGKTFTNSTTSGLSGSMTNNGAVSPSGLNCGGSYTIPAGYHNGSGKVTANSLASQTPPASGKTAAGAGQILTGYSAWVNGSQVNGTMANNGTVSPSGLNCGGSYTIPAGYHSGSGKVTANSLASQTKPASGKTAVGAGQMLTGYSGWVNGSQVNGTMANQGTKTYTINPGGSQTIPAGYHNGNGKVTANPNQNSGLYIFPVGHTGTTEDLGVNNTIQKVNAGNVYLKGKSDGSAGVSGYLNYSSYGTRQTIITGLSSIHIFKIYRLASNNNTYGMVWPIDASGNQLTYGSNSVCGVTQIGTQGLVLAGYIESISGGYVSIIDGSVTGGTYYWEAV